MKCKFPRCNLHAEKTWALVPLCKDHNEKIHHETMKYYRPHRGIAYEDREYYLHIVDQIPWSRKVAEKR